MTTQSVLWVVPDLVITLPYKLPSMTTTRENGSLSGGSGSGLSVWLNGIKVATDARTGRDLKRQLLLSPLADCLHAVPCNRCGRLPHVNLHAGTLEHRHKDCGTQIKMVRDSLTPSPVQIALWNRKLYRRPGTTTLLPLSRPHFMILGVLREPTEFDRVKRIRRIEAYSLDE